MSTITEQIQQQNKKSEQSRNDYQKSLGDYLSSTGKFSTRIDNPIHEVIRDEANEREKAERRKWEKAAAFTGLTTIAQSIGAAVAGGYGAKVPDVNDSAFKYSIDQIQRSDKRVQDNYDRYYKSALTESIRQDNRQDKVEDNYLKGLDNIRRSDMTSDMLDRKLMDDKAERNQKQEWNEKKLNASAAKKAQPTVKKVAKEDKADMYVFDSNGNRVPLKKEHMTKLHQIGKMHNIDGDYKKSKNDFQREREYDILIQRAYLLYENEKTKSGNK